MPTFDGVNLTITLDSGVTELDVQADLYQPWKDWMLASPKNRKYPPAFRTIGGDPLSSIINAGSYFFLRNDLGWRIKPPEEDITIYTVGNLAAEDTQYPAFVPTDGAYTAAILGLQPVTQGVTPVMAEQLEHSSFQGGVWIDTINGYPGTTGTIGNSQYPSNNIDDAYTIAYNRGFRTFFVVGNLSLTNASPNLSNYSFVGQGKARTTITIDAAATVTDCEYFDAHIVGTLDGNSRLRDCLIDNLQYIKGYIEQCVLAPGTILLAGSEEAHFLDCWSGQPGSGTPIIDMGGSGQALALRNYNGGITLKNKSGTEAVSIDLNSGQVVIDSTVTNGEILVRGVGSIRDNHTGTALVINQMVNGSELGDIKRLIALQDAHHTALGETWYWDPIYGDDTYAGDHISRPVKTFAQAHALANDNNHDLIICVARNPAGTTLTTENLVITKNYLFVRGPGRDFEIKSANDALDAIRITGNGVEISGIVVSTSNTNTKHTISSEGNFALIKDVWIRDAVKGIHILNSEYTEIDNVQVHHNLGYGIKIDGTSEHVNIKDCHIGSNTGDGITIDLTPGYHEVNLIGDTVIHSNTGYGINISANTSGVIIHPGVTVFNNTSGQINNLGSNTYNVSDNGEKISEIWQMLGLDATNPMDISATQHTSTSITVTITDNLDGSVTLQRV